MSGANTPFWEKPLDQLSRGEWESLCDGCGKCCLHKVEDADTGEVHPTNVACKLLDRHSGLCSNYRGRHAYVPDCVRLTAGKVGQLPWLPSTCAYRLRGEGKPLPAQGGDTSAPLQLTVSARARKMRLKVDPRTGAVQLTVPRRVSQRKALEWAAGHRDWIENQLARITPPEPLGPGACVPLYGLPHRIEWSADRSRVIKLEEGRILAGGPLDGLEARILRWLKRHALDVLTRETAEYAARAGVTVTRIAIGDPLTRWGSCSSSGAIRYNWRLILAPDHVRRATVAHEVAHRIHMNHGPAFHALVAQLFEADPKPARDWLRSHGATLHRIGRG